MECKQMKQACEEAYKHGYDEGYKKCLSENDFDSPCASCDMACGIIKGREEAWETARKICEMDTDEATDVFGAEFEGLWDILRMDYIEVAAKLEKYEMEKEKPLTNAQKFEQVFGVKPPVWELKDNGIKILRELCDGWWNDPYEGGDR